MAESGYVGRHRGAPEPPPVTWPAFPPGFDAWGQPICTCPLIVGDFPVYDVTCRKHGYLVSGLLTVTTTGSGLCRG